MCDETKKVSFSATIEKTRRKYIYKQTCSRMPNTKKVEEENEKHKENVMF